MTYRLSREVGVVGAEFGWRVAFFGTLDTSLLRTRYLPAGEPLLSFLTHAYQGLAWQETCFSRIYDSLKMASTSIFIPTSARVLRYKEGLTYWISFLLNDLLSYIICLIL